MFNGRKINFFEVLGVISVVLFLAGSIFYLIGLAFYLYIFLYPINSQAQPYTWFDIIWTPIIIVFPFIIQFTIFFRFFNKSRADEELSVFFKVYSKFMCIGLSLYSLIWCIYNITLVFNPGATFLTILSILSVIFILVLVWIIINCTRIITRDSFEKNDGLFKSSDLTNEEYKKLCDRLEILLKNEDILKKDEDELEKILTDVRSNENWKKSEFEEEWKKIQDLLENFSSVELSAPTLEKKDIEHIVAVLTDSQQPVQIKPLKRILALLKEDNNIWIRKALISKNFESVTKHLLLRSFNIILKNPQYFDQKEFSAKGVVTPVDSAARYFGKRQEGLLFTEHVQVENRKLFDEHIIKVLRQEEEEFDSKNFQIEDEELKFKDRILQKSQNFLRLGSDDHTDLKIKEGIARFPFDIMSFFFTIFLCITYLFGFSFAFHDRSNLLTSKSKTPALFMEANYVDKKSDGLAVPAKTPNKQPTFFLFYEPADAGIKTDINVNSNSKNVFLQTENTNLNANTQAQYLQSNRYIANKQNFDDLIDTVKKTAQTEKRVYVEIVGRADDASVNKRENDKQTYSSNYELSLARAENLKFELIRQLQETSGVLEKIEWRCLPVSNDESLGSDYPLNEPTHRPSIVLNNLPVNKTLNEKKIKTENRKNLKGSPKQLDETIEENKNRIDKIVGNMSEPSGDTDLGERDNLRNQNKDISRQANTAKLLFTDGKVTTGKDGEALISKLQSAVELYRKLIDTAKLKSNITSSEYKADQEKLELLKKKIESALNFYQSDANKANKRITEVYITSIPENDFIVSGIELNLMDYILYSITNSDYGDIKPTTMYAKFLSILVIIVELFFLVVFFNVLMSVKRVNTEDDLFASS